jgi:hypothetical protein
MQLLRFAPPLPAFITPPSFLTLKTTTQRLAGDGTSSAVARASAGFQCPPILCHPQDHRAEAILIRVRLYVAPND